MILNGQKPEVSPLRSGTTFSIILKVLANAIGEKRKLKNVLIGKEEIKQSLFSGDMITYWIVLPKYFILGVTNVNGVSF